MKNKPFKTTIMIAAKKLSKDKYYQGKFDNILILTGERKGKDLIHGRYSHGYSSDLLDICFEEMIERYVKYAKEKNLSLDDLETYVKQYLHEYKKLNRIITLGDISK